MKHNISVARVRSKLPERREQYWQAVSRGKHIGVRRLNGNEHWHARAAVEGKKYEYKPLEGATSWEEAVRAAEPFFKFIDQGGKNSRDTVLELFDDYCKTVKPSPTHGTVRKTLEPELGSVKLSDLKATHIKRWKNSDALLAHNEKVRAPATINRMMTVLRAALNYGVKEQLLMDSSWRTQLDRLKEDSKRKELYVTPEERRKLIECAATDAKPFIHLMSIMPLRPGDWSQTTPKEFDKKARTLFAKSKDHPRHVPLSGAAYDLLTAQAKDKLPNALLFVRQDGRAWDKQSWNAAIKEAAKRAGLSEAINLYALRHSTITDLCVGGLDIHTIAKTSGTSIAMIERHYGKLLKNVATDALDRIAV